MNVSGFPYQTGYCGEARLAMVSSGIGEWFPRGDNHIPTAGDLIYYGEVGAEKSRHVGLVVIGGNDFVTIEGNMGGNENQSLNKVKRCTGSVSNGKCNNSYYQGFLHLKK